MKTSSTKLTALFIFAISLSAIAQNRNGGPRPATPTEGRYHSGNTNSNNQNNGYYSGGFYFNYNNNGAGYYTNYYNNAYNLKKAAKMNLQRSAQIIGDAVYASEWNDIYSPWLAKAIRHQQYARDLYFWGDYAGALNHTERAAFLAISTLNYTHNGGYGYNNGAGNYPNPYGDPNNPYYRQGNAGTPQNDGITNYGSGNSQRKASDSNTTAVVDMSNDLDQKLPQGKTSDRELLKVNAKDLSVE